ncbi:MAG: amino acid permease [Chloroflexi bacterium]|nr:amino acid permease [Chloroflexota bacterium]
MPTITSSTASAEKLSLSELIALGVGGMVGGGIFSVLGLSAQVSGHAAPLAFAFGGVIALLTGYSYVKLGLHFRSDGGSFTYLEHAFAQRNIAGMGGWLLLVGYIGAMGLYAYTFGVYGAAMLGGRLNAPLTSHLLSSLVLLVFLGVNLYGVKASGGTELILVAVKVAILALFAAAGLMTIQSNRLTPLLDKGAGGLIMGAALIFVAYEGFELIPNAVNEMKDPERNLGKAIFVSIGVTIIIYIGVALVAVGNLTPEEINQYKEYALAVAAKPALGEFGFLLIGLGALLSTSSAINATMFGTARLGMAMAQDEELPKVFSYTERTKPIPWVSLAVIALVTLVFVNIANLTIISSFASSTFLLLFIAINFSAIRLSKTIRARTLAPGLGLTLAAASWVVLMGYLWRHSPQSLYQIGLFYAVVVVAELVFSKRALLARGPISS